MILDLIKGLLKTLKNKNQLTREELRSHFDEEWKKWMEEIPSICSYESEKSVLVHLVVQEVHTKAEVLHLTPGLLGLGVLFNCHA